MVTLQYTEDDVKCVLYSLYVDAQVNVEKEFDTHITPSQIIYSEEANNLLAAVKDTHEEYADLGSGYEELIVVYEEWDLNNPDDEKILLEKRVQPQMARYKRGKEILKTNKLIESDSSMCLSDYHYDEMAQGQVVTSPAISLTAGYRATTEHFRWVALAQRKQVA